MVSALISLTQNLAQEEVGQTCRFRILRVGMTAPLLLRMVVNG